MSDNAQRIDYPAPESIDECLEADDKNGRGGILSPSDRRLILEGEPHDADPNQIRQQRYQLRQRFLRGLQDMAYFRYLSKEDKRQLFQAIDGLSPDGQERVWRGFAEIGYDLLYPLDVPRFETLLADFLRLNKQFEYYIEHGEFLPVEIEFEEHAKEPVSMAELMRKSESGEDLSLGARMVLAIHYGEKH